MLEPSCSECGEQPSHANHARTSSRAHFFHTGTQLRRDVRAAEDEKKNSTTATVATKRAHAPKPVALIKPEAPKIKPLMTPSECFTRRHRLRLTVTELSGLSRLSVAVIERFEAGGCMQNLRRTVTPIDLALWRVERARFGWRHRDQVPIGMLLCELCARLKARPNDVVCRTCAKVLGGGPLPKRDALAFEEFRLAPPFSA